MSSLLVASLGAQPLVPVPEVDLAGEVRPVALARVHVEALELDGARVSRWYRLIRVGDRGAAGPPVEVRVPGHTAPPEVRRARRWGAAGGRPLDHRLERGPGGDWVLRADPGAGPGGELVEVLIEHRHRDAFTALDFSPSHSFGGGMPAVEEVFEIRHPEVVPVRYLARGLGAASSPDVQVGAGTRVLRWNVAGSSTSAPGAGQRPYVRSTRLDSWEPVARWYRTRHQARTVVTPTVRALARRLAGAAREPRQVLARLAAAVADGIEYRSVRDGSERDLVGRPADAVLRDGAGNCADQANLLVALMAARGLRGDVVLATLPGARPIDPEVPTYFPGDHAIVRARVGGQEVFFDPTAAGYRLGDLPPHLRGVLAWAPATGEFTRTPRRRDRVRREVRGQLSAEGLLAAQATLRMRGQGAAKVRRLAARDPGRARASLERLLVPPDARVRDLVVSGVRDGGDEVVVTARFHLELTPEDGRVEVAPPLPPPPPLHPGSASPGRPHLVDAVELWLPAGSAVERYPTPSRVEGDGARFQAAWTVAPGALRMDSEYLRVAEAVAPGPGQARSAWGREAARIRLGG